MVLDAFLAIYEFMKTNCEEIHRARKLEHTTCAVVSTFKKLPMKPMASFRHLGCSHISKAIAPSQANLFLPSFN